MHIECPPFSWEHAQSLKQQAWLNRNKVGNHCCDIITMARWQKETLVSPKRKRRKKVCCAVLPEDWLPTPVARSFSNLWTRSCKVALSCSKVWIVPCSVLTEALSPRRTASYKRKKKHAIYRTTIVCFHYFITEQTLFLNYKSTDAKTISDNLEVKIWGSSSTWRSSIKKIKRNRNVSPPPDVSS